MFNDNKDLWKMSLYIMLVLINDQIDTKKWIAIVTWNAQTAQRKWKASVLLLKDDQ